jgi:hypothetical protein
MQHCDDICTQIAIGERADPEVQTHLAHCVACSDYAAQMTALDQQLSKLLRPVPSDTLTLQLMAIAADHAMPMPRRRQPWWGALVVFAIGVVALGFSVLISAEIVVLFAGSYGFGAYAQQITALPQTGYTWLVSGSPVLQTVISKLDTMRVQLVGILVVALMLFGYTSQRSKRVRS